MWAALAHSSSLTRPSSLSVSCGSTICPCFSCLQALSTTSQAVHQLPVAHSRQLLHHIILHCMALCAVIVAVSRTQQDFHRCLKMDCNERRAYRHHSSMRVATARSTPMALSGYAPAALSPESMSASARCRTTSEMSATCRIPPALGTLQWLLLNGSMSLNIQAQYRRMCMRGDCYREYQGVAMCCAPQRGWAWGTQSSTAGGGRQQ